MRIDRHGDAKLTYSFSPSVLILQAVCEHDMRLDVVRLQLHNFLQQFGFLGEVSLRPFDKRPVEVAVWIARSEMDRQSKRVASLPIPLHVSKNARPIQM